MQRMPAVGIYIITYLCYAFGLKKLTCITAGRRSTACGKYTKISLHVRAEYISKHIFCSYG
jgi:hypothetical protein